MPSGEAVIEEIRESRRRMSRQRGNDPARYIQYLKTFNQKYSAQVQKYRRQHPAPPAEIARPK